MEMWLLIHVPTYLVLSHICPQLWQTLWVMCNSHSVIYHLYMTWIINYILNNIKDVITYQCSIIPGIIPYILSYDRPNGLCVTVILWYTIYIWHGLSITSWTILKMWLLIHVPLYQVLSHISPVMTDLMGYVWQSFCDMPFIYDMYYQLHPEQYVITYPCSIIPDIIPYIPSYDRPNGRCLTVILWHAIYIWHGLLIKF